MPKERLVTDEQVVNQMLHLGGSFIRALAAAFHVGDTENRQKIKDTWPEYWDKYHEYARFSCPRCGETGKLSGHYLQDDLATVHCDKCEESWRIR